jgi:hypothetical protein
VAPDDVVILPGRVCVGGGAVRYRDVLEAKGAVVPPDDDPVHQPRARFHAALATDFGAADLVNPMYLRIPDADKIQS